MLHGVRHDLSVFLDSAASFMFLVILATSNGAGSRVVTMERPLPAGTGHPVPDDISPEERPGPPPSGTG